MGWAKATIFVCAASVCSALAGSYDDFSRGLSAINRGDTDTGISSFTAALAAGDLAPGYVPNAYFGRAKAYLSNNRCTEALSDLDAGLKLRANDVDALLLHAEANGCLNRVEAAEADFNTVLVLRPNALYYDIYARFEWRFGLFSQAAESSTRAFKLTDRMDNHRPYILLRYAISASRAGTFDQAAFAADMSDLDTDDWPDPLLKFYLGKTTPDKIYGEAANGDTMVAANQKCEADFYIAEWRLVHENAATAKPLLQQVVSECPHNFSEYHDAQIELKRNP